MFVLAIYCKAANFSLGDTIRFVRDLATFSMMRNVGREAQKNFWSSHAEYKGIRIFIHKHFAGIYESPFKLTFTRCLWAATCLVPTASDLAPLYVKDESVAPKLIARVCRLQMDAGEVKAEGGSTSTSEHLFTSGPIVRPKWDSPFKQETPKRFCSIQGHLHREVS